MKKKVLVSVSDLDTEFEFSFGHMGSEDIIFETKLNAAQLLQIFQHSGIDFYEHETQTTEK